MAMKINSLIMLSLIVITTALIESPIREVEDCLKSPLQKDDDGYYCDGPNVRMKLDQEIRSQCTDCKCDKTGLFCCAVGYKKVFGGIEGCKMKKEIDTCCYQFYESDNPSEPCGTKTCPSNELFQ